MPTLYLDGTYVADLATSANEVMEDFFKEGQNNNSFEIINGHLKEDNLHSAVTISSDHMKRNMISNGQMVGLTGNLDYSQMTFPADSTDDGAFTAIPGLGITFHLPYAPSLVVFTWQLTTGNDVVMTSAFVHEFQFFVDDTAQANQFRPSPRGVDGGGNRRPHRDRVWSGHCIRTDLSAGWHSAHVGAFVNGYVCRLRVRNIKVIWFK